MLRKRAINNFRSAALLLAACLFACFLASAPLYAEDDPTPISVGVLTGPAPYYGFNEATGETIGFALEMWAQVAKRAGLSYQLVYFDTPEQLQKAAAAKTIDVVPLLAVNPETSKIFEFTETVHASRVMIFTRKSRNDIARLSNLAGHRVSVVNQHVGQALMRDFRGELSITHDSLDDALGALMTRTSDAIVYEADVMWQLARQQGVDSLLKTVGTPLREIDMAIAVRKGRHDVMSAIVPALTSYFQSGAYWAAREPWGGNPPPLIAPGLAVKMLGAMLAMTIVGFGLWRHFSVVRLNQALARSVREQQAAEERFKDVAEAASDWFFEQDQNLRFTFLSSRFEEVTGIPSARLIGRTRWDDAALSGSRIDTDAWREHIATLEAHEDWRDFSYTIADGNGDQRTVTTSGKAVFDATGKFIGYRGVGRDITRRIKLEGALQQAQKMELVGQLTGGIAHDFNNLLTVMVGNLEMLKRAVRDDPRCRSYLDTTSEAVDIGSRLVQRLLGFSRRQSLNPDSIDLNVLVSDMMRLINSSLGPDIETRLALGRRLPPVFADEVQLQNALLNLAINARDAMPEGGSLIIETTELHVDQAFVDRHPQAMPGHYLALHIRDSGFGIAKDDLAKVIEPFFTTKEVGKGSGLGLSMVYGFARQSNGFLLIDSELGAGTTVSICLPVGEARPTVVSEAAADLGFARRQADLGTGHTVLVVEDDARVREVTIARLQHLGYDVLDVENAAEALETLENRPAIDLVLTDIMMPGGMSGIELAQEVRRKRPDIKIVFSAAYSKQADDLHEQGKLGPWLRKPYRQADLAAKLREALS